jgi:hypothetical protein
MLTIKLRSLLSKLPATAKKNELGISSGVGWSF